MMTKHNVSSGITNILLILSLCFFVISCGCDEDCAEFSNFSMCDTAPSKDGCPGNTNIFSQDAEYITVSVEITHGEPNDIFSMKMYFNESGNFTEFATQSISLKDIDEDIDGTERKVRASTGVVRRADRMWPKGEYKVEIELSQENIPLNATQNFSVD